MGGCVVRPFAFFIQTLDVTIIDFRDVAHHVRQRLAVRIVAALVAFHFHARETVLVHCEARDLHFIQAGFDRNGGKAARALALFFKRIDVIVGQIQHRPQILQRLLQVIDFFRHQLGLVNGAIERQRHTVAVIDDAAAGGDRHQFDAVFV